MLEDDDGGLKEVKAMPLRTYTGQRSSRRAKDGMYLLLMDSGI